MKKNRMDVLYCVLVLGICLLPLAGMIFWPTMQTTENTTLAQWPALTDESGIHTDFLQQAGEYFTDHFAFRQELVAADAPALNVTPVNIAASILPACPTLSERNRTKPTQTTSST